VELDTVAECHGLGFGFVILEKRLERAGPN
jgi:hypothetical protein